MAGGEFIFGGMVVDDHNVDACIMCGRQRLDRNGAGIKDADQICATLLEGQQTLGVRAIALSNPIRNINLAIIYPAVAQKAHQDCTGGGAINVIIRPDGNFLTVANSLNNAVRRPVHILEKGWVGKRVADRGG